MTIEESAQAILHWLSTQPGCAFLSAVQGAEIGPCCYRLGIQQIEPEQKRRIFEVKPLDVADCYEITEAG